MYKFIKDYNLKLVSDMQGQSYRLPHQFESWTKSRSHLQKMLQLSQLSEMVQQMKQINKEEFDWHQDVFLSTDRRPAEIVSLLKFAAQACLKVETLFPESILISNPIQQPQGITSTILSKKQCLSLVSNMFFGTTCRQPDSKNLPHYINFSRLSRRPNQIVKTILNYFDRCIKNQSQSDKQSILFFRIAQTPKFESWLQCEQKLCQVRFHQKGSIEDLESSIQIDFANKSIGGFFLSETFTQEDIIFINNPELMPAVLFHKYMAANECILMVGAERFSKYTGYLDSYKFAGDFKDERKIIEIKVSQNKTAKVRDAWISAIDAIPYFISSQFSNTNLNRELNKAYVGFNIMNLDGGHKAISTGNWGSGAFNGNLEYKFLIQWLAASRARRSIDYFSFGDDKATEIPKIIQQFNGFTVKQLTQILVKNSQKFESLRKVFKTLLKSSKTAQKVEQQQQISV